MQPVGVLPLLGPSLTRHTTSEMSAFLKTGLYLACHFALYAMILRRLRIFRLEGTIFLYHALSAIVLFLTLISTSNSLAVIAGCLSMQGIYSLSFLELWSLAEGGYSLNILRLIQKETGRDPQEQLEKIGTSKKANRTELLIHLKLVVRVDRTIRITKAGRLIAIVLNLIAGFTLLEEIG